MAVDYQTVLWDSTGPYWAGDGKKHYIPPITAAEMDDPRVKAWAASRGARVDAESGVYESGAPGGSLLKTRGTWNPETGQYDQGVNWGNVLSLATAAALTGGAISAVAGSGTAGAAGGASGAASGAGAGAGAGAVTAAGSAAAKIGLGSTLAKYGLQYALPVAGSIYATRLQANAERDAAKLQADYNEKALQAALDQQAWERQQELDRIKREQEQQAYARATAEEKRGYDRGQYSQYLGRLDPFRTAGQGALPRLDALLGGPSSAGVLMRAPTGDVQHVAPGDVERALALGAARV